MEERIDILLVDDEARNLDALESILADPAYRLLRAESADGALKQLLEHEVAAIVLDIKMPGVSGFELAQIIKGSKKFRQIPIVFLTAYMLEDQDVITGYGAGAVDYLTKPVKPQILRHKVAVFADLFRKSRALADLNERLEARVVERTSELQRSEAALLEASRQKDQFLATLAHELRNPLAPLRMGLDILLKVEPPTPLVGKTLGAMNRQLDHMVRLVDDLLDVSRISRGVLELRREQTDLSKLIETAIDSTRSFSVQRRQTITLVDGKPVSAFLDPTRVLQILANLLHNASKYTPEGGTVRVEIEKNAGDAVIRVIDNGMGIPGDQIEHVFDMFARVERPGSHAMGGLGIGLALSRRLAEMHGGNLVASSPGAGQGSTFTLTLPTTDGKAPSPSPPEPAAGKKEVAASGPSLDVLIVEDNDDVADTLAMWLENAGHKVQVARNGAEGLAMIEKTRPTLVFCDLGLPELDGIEVCRRARALPLGYRPMMVALTGWGMDEDRRRTKAAGFDHHLVKPVSPEKLKDILAQSGRDTSSNVAPAR